MAGKWTHFDTYSLLPNLKHVRPSEHSNNYMCCLREHAKILR